MISWWKRPPKPPPPPCPECGKPTTLGGRFCRACGWDADVDERGEGYLDGVDLPEAIEDEGHASPGRRLYLAVVTLVVLAAFAWTAIFWGG